MELSTLAVLAGIALIDSTSIGTLVIPIWLMLDRRRSAGNVVPYLVTLSVFYFAAGLALMSGARVVIDAAGDRLAEFFASTTGGYVVVAIGAALIALSFWLEPKRRERARAARGEDARPSWSERLGDRDPTARSTVTLALAAGTIEIATMLPYLAAIGIITTLDVSVAVRTGLLGGYVVVMAVPALILLGARIVAGDRVAARLERIRAWLMKHAEGTISILVLILGIHVVLRGLALVQ